MELAEWILEELEDMPLEILADAVESKTFKPLLINDGHIIGCKKQKPRLREQSGNQCNYK